MARPKAFNRQEALDKAMHLFWMRGFEAVTMTDLRKEMGIGRQSLYDTFGDKNQLFTEALRQYMGMNDANVTGLLDKDEGLAGIRRFFDSRVEMLSTGERRGCLMMNSCVELSLHDQAVASMLEAGLATVQKGFEATLAEAARRGELSTNADVKDLASFLLTQVAGMVVMSKNNASEQQLRAAADLALSTLT